MPRLLHQDFRLELWGFDALLRDGTYLFALFADVVILGTRHGITVGRVFPPGDPPWGTVRRVPGRAIACVPDQPGVAFGPSRFVRGPEEVTAVLQDGIGLSLAYRGPFVRCEPAGPVWEKGNRRINWALPVMRAPVRVAVENPAGNWEEEGEGTHAYVIADFHPWKVPMRSLAVGHLYGQGGAAFYLHAENRRGDHLVDVAVQQGSHASVVRTEGDLNLSPEGPYLATPGFVIHPEGGHRILAGSPLELIQGLPAWVLALANRITLGIEVHAWVGKTGLRGNEAAFRGSLVHAGIYWP